MHACMLRFWKSRNRPSYLGLCICVQQRGRVLHRATLVGYMYTPTTMKLVPLSSCGDSETNLIHVVLGVGSVGAELL